jgi:hypothetical protein
LDFRKFIYSAWFLLGVFFLQGYGQTAKISGIINQYASVEAIYCQNENDVDSLLVASLPSAFGEGDTVMLYCVQGAEIELTDIFGEDDIGRDAQNPRNTGKYAFLIIDEIVGNVVVLNSTVRPEIRPMGNGEVAQLIRVPSYRRAEVTSSGVTAQAWNGATGGVVTFFVTQALRLNGNIDVSGKGFRGAVASELYNGACSSTNPALYDSTFYHIDNVKAGKKGEGTTDTRFELMRGKAMNINGGGGGNALFSGGGGGSNYSFGGRGGDEASQCAPGVESPGGAGGFDLGRSDAYYKNRSEDIVILNRFDRIFFGGGGGIGTRMAGRTYSSGGNGGGLVVIVADTIDGNGHWILADGKDVTAAVTGAGAGGGGGGGIILDVSGYKNNLRLSAVGGDGGDTNHPTDTTGPGGGGGGGIYWLAGVNEPGVSPDLTLFGASGEHIPSSKKYGAADGARAGKKNGLDAPLRGFLFNSVPTTFTVCSDQVPETIFASRPKGGDGVNYNYQWVDSSSTQQMWLPAPGTNNQQNYAFSAPLTDTTYFRRIVTSGILPADTSFRIAVYVHQAITGNTIASPDTVCYGNVPEAFVPVGSPGGGLGAGTYSYRWLKAEGGGNYSVASGANTGPGYTAPGLTVTTDFARVTYSGACIDTSNALTATVLAALTGNTISPNDTICQNTRPDLMTGPIPGGGDPADKRYRWESSPAEAGPWTGVGVTTLDYRPGPLSQTVWYRRVALSGSDDACVDFSDPLEILNIAPITANSVLTVAQDVCTFHQPGILQGSDPGGGYQGLYSWRWESRTLATDWGVAEGTSDQKSYSPPVMTGDTTWYRRIVGSGGEARNVCTNASDSVVINVLPAITNNDVLTTGDLKCQYDFLDDLTQEESGGTTPGGGATQGGIDNTRNYKWEEARGMGSPGGTWTEVSYGPGEIDYTDHPQLTSEEDYWYRRIVFSGPDLGGQQQVCSDTSEVLRITVHTAITGNTIDPADSVCFNSEKLVHGEAPEGEPSLNPTYTWKDILTGQDLPGSDSQDYTYHFDQLTPYRFQRVVAIGACLDTSNTMVITVMQLPGGTLSGDLPRACEKDTLLNVDLNIDRLGTYITPWEVYLDNGVHTEMTGPYFMDADGTLNVTLETDQDEDSTQFSYQIGEILYRSTTGRFECVSPPDSISGTVPIEVFRKPQPLIWVGDVAPDSFKVCSTTMPLGVDADNGTGMWTSDPPGVFFSPGPEYETVLASIPDSHDDFGKYVITFTSHAGDCVGTDALDAHFFEQPAPAYAGEDTMIFLINSVQLRADPPTAGSGTWTLEAGSGIIADEHAPNTLAYELGMGQENKFKWTVVNGEDEGTCVTSSDVTIVIRNEVRRYSGFSPNGDDWNEYYIMQGLKYADEFSISFFNALGKTVRTINQDNIGDLDVDPALILDGLKEDEMVVWDGMTDHNNPVPSGTYYYIVEFFVHQKNPVTGEVIRTDKYSYKDFVIVARE